MRTSVKTILIEGNSFRYTPSRNERITKWADSQPGDVQLRCMWVVLRGYQRAMDRFKVLPLDQLRALPIPYHTPDSAGVYFLWVQSALVYVGKSKKVSARVNQHKLAGKAFSHATCFKAPEDLCGAFERFYINRYRPCDNVII